jgi:hypothetical protein
VLVAARPLEITLMSETKRSRHHYEAARASLRSRLTRMWACHRSSQQRRGHAHREMYATTKEHLSDRKLKKVTDANYVRHRESSIKTITRMNFELGTHFPYSFRHQS